MIKTMKSGALIAFFLFMVSEMFSVDASKTIEQRIREKYQDEFRDDIPMQEKLIKDEINSFRLLQKNKSAHGVPQEIFDNRGCPVYC